ncbi:Crinkler (CRN) family protein, partial [Phytophthora palmivora]
GDGSVFTVVVNSTKVVDILKKAIKKKNPATIKFGDGSVFTVVVNSTKLFLAKKGGAWLTEADVKKGVEDTTGFTLLDVAGAPLNLVDLSEEDVRCQLTKEAVKAKKTPVHVLVVVPGKGKRCRADGWFGESFLPLPKKRKVDKNKEEINQVTRFFEMRDFPPLAHKKIEYKVIVERKAYRVIFTELMKEVQSSFEYVEPGKDSKPGKDSNLIVTGNPGIGKSRFYLYCIFQLILGEREDVKKLLPYELVLNYGSDFRKYDAERKEFVELDGEEVVSLQTQRRVLRLVEATSTQLVGWSGVSILFASPGVKGIKDFAKVDGGTYIMPAWTFEELREYNSLLPDNLQLAEDDLVSRYDIFGGIPRFVFTRANHSVKEEDYSHRVLEMVPTRDDFRADYHLDFLSKHIAELVVAKVHGESLDKISEFAITHDNDDSGSTSVVRGKIYEMLCHKWFSLPQQKELHFRSLCSTTLDDLTIPQEMQTVRFTTLDKLQLAQGWTYYRPTSKTFGALDAFISDGNECYGLQMTLNKDHGIKAAPMNKFLKWLKDDARLNTDQFYFIFVVPGKIADSYRKQATRTTTGLVSQKPGALAKVNQFVTALDVFSGGN